MESSALAALRAYVARLPRCYYYTFRETPGAALPRDMVLCPETGLWHHSGLFACDAHGGEKNPWKRPLVEIGGAAEIRVLIAFLATADQPDRGLLMVQATAAASDVYNASARRVLVNNSPKATAADRERARRAEEAAEVRQMNADAAFEAAGGRYNLCLIPFDHSSQITITQGS